MKKGLDQLCTAALIAGSLAPAAYAQVELAAPPITPLVYPETRRGDVLDDYHGIRVADPYRWLEDLDSEETAAWVRAQNAMSQPFLEGIPGREAIKERLTELWNYERYDAPFTEGGRYFFFRNDGLQNQDVLYVTDDLDAEPRVLLDPNTLREDATVSLGGYAVSPGGRYLAYGLSDGGTDWRIWRIRDVATGKDLRDDLRGSKFSSPVAWAADESGFYYYRYPQRPDGSYDDGQQPSIYFHRVGTEQAEDRSVYEPPQGAAFFPFPAITEDGRYLMILAYAGSSSNGLFVKDLTRPDAPMIRLAEPDGALYAPIGSNGTELYLLTTADAPRGRVVAVDLDRPEPEHWRTLIPQAAETLENVSYAGDRFLAQYLQDARSVVRVYDRAGQHVQDVALPGIGSVAGFGGDADDTETFFEFASFTTPGAIYRYDLGTGEVELWKEARPAGMDAADYEVKQVFYTSKDGTRVPMFIVHKKGLELDGQNPTLLYGYGGFNASMTPYYSTVRLAWLEMGGVFALANLRGGGEYGEAWHEAGTKLNKQNVFDDFIAAAEWLIEKDYTSPEKLAIQGGSNGGLLVGAAITQRPDLFGAALPAVGVLDMLRYHTPSANARLWSADYGLSENPEEFKALYAYSPYHNVEEGTCYPPTLVTTADHDDRVVPWHSYKFAAALQHAQDCPNPVLIRVETRAGHGAGTPTWMVIEQYADQWAFLTYTLGMAN